MGNYVKPVEGLCREFSVPGDKSITHRAVMFNSIAEGRATITGGLLGEDCVSTINCMRGLGAEISLNGGVISIRGAANLKDGAILDAGNSGTTMRLLAGILAGAGVNATITGDASLSRRPMKRVTEPLSRMGAAIESHGGCAPLAIKPARLKGIKFENMNNSAQVKSAVLLAGLGAEGETEVKETVPSRDHTEIMLRHMGADISVEDGKTTIRSGHLHAADIEVPGDISSAAFLFALGAILPGSRVTVKGVGVNPTRTGILSVLSDMGAEIEIKNKRSSGGEPCADITVAHRKLRGINIGGAIIPALIDELPVIAVLAAFAEGHTTVTDARELRVKETDRIKTIADNLNAAGGCVTDTEDGFVIEGRGRLEGGSLAESFGDHRIAMSMAIAGMCSRKGITIGEPECVNISYPGFFEVLGEI